MLFNSLTFAIFFICTYAGYWSLKKSEARKTLLLVASYLFYANWSPPYVLLLFISTLWDWMLARRISRSKVERVRRSFLILSLIGNLGLLGYFKYGNFLLHVFSVGLNSIGLLFNPAPVDIVLPIGISFYTFASLSYTIDVYRKEIDSRWSFRDYALFVSFFPHLVAGPIVRARVLLPQIQRMLLPTRDQVGWGVYLFVIGLFGKVVLADNLFAPIVDQVYNRSTDLGALDAWTGVLCFSAQIYFDFAGYSTCATGLAYCFGVRFPENFWSPYAASGFSDFWRRWHISLSSWLRDYLYIPLGGNRKGESRSYLNLLITMLLGGLWHGASWMFVLWGLLHGTYLIVERAFRAMPFPSASSGNSRVLKMIATFTLVTLTWIPFRAGSSAVAENVLLGLGELSKYSFLDWESQLVAFAGIPLMFYWQYRQRESSLANFFRRQSSGIQAVILAFFLVALFAVSGGDKRAFLYFQF